MGAAVRFPPSPVSRIADTRKANCKQKAESLVTPLSPSGARLCAARRRRVSATQHPDDVNHRRRHTQFSWEIWEFVSQLA